MKREELTMTFMIISNWRKRVGLHGLHNNISALWGLNFHLKSCVCGFKFSCSQINMLYHQCLNMLNRDTRLNGPSLYIVILKPC